MPEEQIEQIPQPPRFTGFGGNWDKAAVVLGSIAYLVTLPLRVVLATLYMTPGWAWVLLALIYFLH
jgi:hypothetical protein